MFSLIMSLLPKENMGFEEYFSKRGQKECTFSLIIPAYNEERRIVSFLESVIKNLTEFNEVIVVCDGNDKTPDLAKAISNKVMVLEYKSRLGKGGAILEGFKHARGDIVGYVDADGSVPWTEIRKVFHCVSDENPIAIGSRWMKASKITKSQPFSRVVLSRFYHYFVFAFLGLRVKDTQCGIKAYKSDVLDIVSRMIFLKNLSIDTLILYHAHRSGYKIIEVPIQWENVDGSKFSPLKTSLYMFLTVLGIRIMNSRFRKYFKNAAFELSAKLRSV